jgi:hypothetical protein
MSVFSQVFIFTNLLSSWTLAKITTYTIDTDVLALNYASLLYMTKQRVSLYVISINFLGDRNRT